MPVINIELRTKADVSGAAAVHQALGNITAQVAGSGFAEVAKFGAKLSVGMLAAQKAVNAVQNEVKYVIANIEKIPGIPARTVGSILQARQVFEELHVGFRRVIIDGVSGLARLHQGTIYWVQRLVEGKDAADSAFTRNREVMERSAQVAKENAEAIERNKQEMEAFEAASKRAAERFKNWLDIVKSANELDKQLAQVGETPAARVNRLRAELAVREREEAAVAGFAEARDFARERTLRARLALAEAEVDIQRQLADLAERYRLVDFEKLSTAQKIASLDTQLTANRREYTALSTANTDQTLTAIALENQRLDLEKQLTDLRKQQSEEQKKATADALAAQEAQLQRLQSERQIAATRGDKIEVNRLLTLERNLVVDIAAAYRAIAAAAKDPAAREAALARAAAMEGSLPRATKSKFQNTSDTFNARNNPENSYQGMFEGLKGGFLEFANSVETNSNLIANSIRTNLQTAVDGVSDGIYGLITRTKTWGQVWSQVGASILQNLIRMGVQIVANKALGSAANATAKAEAVTTGATITASNAPAAATASIASYGGAAVAGSIAAAAAIALIIGMLSRGFAEGGYTGDGGKYAPAGIVHRGEYVFDQASVQRLGIANLEALRFSSRLPGYATGGLVSSPSTSALSPRSGGGSGTVYLVDDMRAARRHQYQTGEFRAAVQKINRRSRG